MSWMVRITMRSIHSTCSAIEVGMVTQFEQHATVEAMKHTLAGSPSAGELVCQQERSEYVPAACQPDLQQGLQDLSAAVSRQRPYSAVQGSGDHNGTTEPGYPTTDTDFTM